VSPWREAASFEGLIVLAVIYFVLQLLQKAGRKAEQARRGSPPRPEEPEEVTATQEESLSLEAILREIEKAKQRQAPPAPQRVELPTRPAPPPRLPPKPPPKKPLPSRRPPPPSTRPAAPTQSGPMGRKGRMELASAEEVEERTILEGESLEQPESLENFDDVHRRRAVIDQDDEAEAIVQRRIQAAEARNRELQATDHRAFDARIRQGEPAGTPRQPRPFRLKDAVVWREILGPPKGLE
jgi:hypothetical protein